MESGRGFSPGAVRKQIREGQKLMAVITLTDEEFALLYTYQDLQHTVTWDHKEVGLTTKLGKQLWDRVQEIAHEQGVEFICPGPSAGCGSSGVAPSNSF
jgi:hypothetical protein